jgi:hypothetical protein
MKIDSFTVSIPDKDGFPLYSEEGPTREAAIEKLLASLKWNLIFDVKITGLRLPESVTRSADFPQNTPEGTALVVLERCSHNHGHPYDWQYIAVPPGEALTCGRKDYGVVKQSRKISFNDSNSEYTFVLPSGSFRYVDGEWKPATRVEYYY